MFDEWRKKIDRWRRRIGAEAETELHDLEERERIAEDRARLRAHVEKFGSWFPKDGPP